MKQSGQYYWYHNDHLGTPQMMTTGSGGVVWKARYTSFGKVVVDPNSTVVNSLRFPGQYEDVETGMHYNGMRYYDIEIGQFLRRDPLNIAQTKILVQSSFNELAKSFPNRFNENLEKVLSFYFLYQYIIRSPQMHSAYSYVSSNPLIYYDPHGLVRWKDAGNAALGVIGNGLGVLVGSALLLAPEPTGFTKVIGALILSKSLVGLGLSAYNVGTALTQDCSTYDAPGSAARAVATIIAPESEDALLIADAVDLGIDLLAGQAKIRPNYMAPKATRPFNVINKTFNQPQLVNTFLTTQTMQVIAQDYGALSGRY